MLSLVQPSPCNLSVKEIQDEDKGQSYLESSVGLLLNTTAIISGAYNSVWLKTSSRIQFVCVLKQQSKKGKVIKSR